MPELPEIETIRRTLTPHLQGRELVGVKIINSVVIKHPGAEIFSSGIQGRVIAKLGRRGKFLLLHLDDGGILALHLRMTGRLLCVPAENEQKPHTHIIFTLNDGRELRFSDTRRFGGLWWLHPGEEDQFSGMQRLGPEPFDPAFSADYLRERLGKRRSPVKNGILDQHVLAGLGNIYADEALFAAKIYPARPCDTLSEAEWQALADAILPVLTAAIANNGTTFSDYLDGEGNYGRNMPFLAAYGRAGENCIVCGAKMEKIRIGGRGTCFCPLCQK